MRADVRLERERQIVCCHAVSLPTRRAAPRARNLCCITTNTLNIPMQTPRTALLVVLTLARLPGTESCSSGKVGDCAQPGQPPSSDRHGGSNHHQSHSTMLRQLSPLPSSNSTLSSLPQEDLANLNAELRTQVAWLSGELVAFQASTILLFMALVCFAVWQHFGGERVRRLVAWHDGQSDGVRRVRGGRGARQACGGSHRQWARRPQRRRRHRLRQAGSGRRSQLRDGCWRRR